MKSKEHAEGTAGQNHLQMAAAETKTVCGGSSTEVPEHEFSFAINDIVGMLKASVAFTATYPELQMPGRYLSVDDFVLQNGRHFMPPKSDVLPHGLRRGRMKHCYENAANVALENDNLIYVEGYAVGVIPAFHAWLVDRKGHVIDPTWREGGTAYFGVPIKTRYLAQILCRQNCDGVINAYKIGWPILKDPESKWRVSIKSAA